MLLSHWTHGVKDKNAPRPHSSVGFLCYRRHIGKQKDSSLRGSTSVNILSEMHCMLCSNGFKGFVHRIKGLMCENCNFNRTEVNGFVGFYLI